MAEVTADVFVYALGEVAAEQGDTAFAGRCYAAAAFFREVGAVQDLAYAGATRDFQLRQLRGSLARFALRSRHPRAAEAALRRSGVE